MLAKPSRVNERPRLWIGFSFTDSTCVLLFPYATVYLLCCLLLQSYLAKEGATAENLQQSNLCETSRHGQNLSEGKKKRTPRHLFPPQTPDFNQNSSPQGNGYAKVMKIQLSSLYFSHCCLQFLASNLLTTVACHPRRHIQNEAQKPCKQEWN